MKRLHILTSLGVLAVLLSLTMQTPAQGHPAAAGKLDGTWFATFRCKPFCVGNPKRATVKTTVVVHGLGHGASTGTIVSMERPSDLTSVSLVVMPRNRISMQTITTAIRFHAGVVGGVITRMSGSGKCQAFDGLHPLNRSVSSTWVRDSVPATAEAPAAETAKSTPIPIGKYYSLRPGCP